MKRTAPLLALTLILGLAHFGAAQTPASPQPPNAAAAPPAAPAASSAPITDADLKSIAAPDPKVRANGDPDGGLTGNVSDITVADPITDKTPKPRASPLVTLPTRLGKTKSPSISCGPWSPAS